MGVDARQVRLEADRLRNVARALTTTGRAVVARGASETKRQLQAEARGVAHAPALPAAITFDLIRTPTSLGFEVGPREGGAGSLALLYFGNSKTGARLKDPMFALQRQADITTDLLTALLVRSQ